MDEKGRVCTVEIILYSKAVRNNKYMCKSVFKLREKEMLDVINMVILFVFMNRSFICFSSYFSFFLSPL